MAMDLRKGMPDPHLGKDAFRSRFFGSYSDPAVDAIAPELEQAFEVAWQAYEDARKAPRTRPAGPGFTDPACQTSAEWPAAHDAIAAAELRRRDPALPTRFLPVNGSPRSEHTCPGEMSKTYRLAEVARAALTAIQGSECDVLDLSRVCSEYGRHVHPCKACFSTSPALCHWPCSCYPNHALGQTNDWMNEIYPMSVAARGIMIICPVHWYQAPAALKSMIDRLVCADGGNLRPAGDIALLDWYVSYWRSYATSHADLDAETALFKEVRNAARALHEGAIRYRSGERAAGGAFSGPSPENEPWRCRLVSDEERQRRESVA